MMRKILNLTLLAAGLMCVSGCGYLADRGRDFGDMTTLTLGSGFGARAVAGPLYVNSIVHYQGDWVGWRNGDFTPTLGRDLPVDRGVALGWGKEWLFPTESQIARGKGYEIGSTGPIPFYMTFEEGGHLHRWFQIELAAAVVVGARVGVNPAEIVDFVVGLATLDIMDDDIGWYPEAETEPEPAPKPEPETENKNEL